MIQRSDTSQEEAHDVGGGLLVAILKEFDGNMIGLRQTA